MVRMLFVECVLTSINRLLLFTHKDVFSKVFKHKTSRREVFLQVSCLHTNYRHLFHDWTMFLWLCSQTVNIVTVTSSGVWSPNTEYLGNESCCGELSEDGWKQRVCRPNHHKTETLAVFGSPKNINKKIKYSYCLVTVTVVFCVCNETL